MLTKLRNLYNSTTGCVVFRMHKSCSGRYFDIDTFTTRPCQCPCHLPAPATATEMPGK